MSGTAEHDWMFVSLAEKFRLDVAVRHAAIMTLETYCSFRKFHEALRHLRPMRPMAAFTSIISYSCIAGVRSLIAGVTHVLYRIGRPAVRRTLPARLLMAGQAESGGLIGFHQKLSYRWIGIFPVRIMTARTLDLSAAIQAHGVARCRVQDLGTQAWQKAEGMVIGKCLIAAHIRCRGSRQGISRALHEGNAA